MELENISKDRKCFVCGEKISNDGITIHHGKEKKQFKMMPLNESAHLECYIEHCIQESIKTKQEIPQKYTYGWN